jgi:hypothetical protein
MYFILSLCMISLKAGLTGKVVRTHKS